MCIRQKNMYEEQKALKNNPILIVYSLDLILSTRQHMRLVLYRTLAWVLHCVECMRTNVRIRTYTPYVQCTVFSWLRYARVSAMGMVCTRNVVISRIHCTRFFSTGLNLDTMYVDSGSHFIVLFSRIFHISFFVFVTFSSSSGGVTSMILSCYKHIHMSAPFFKSFRGL